MELKIGGWGGLGAEEGKEGKPKCSMFETLALEQLVNAGRFVSDRGGFDSMEKAVDMRWDGTMSMVLQLSTNRLFTPGEVAKLDDGKSLG